MKFLVIAAACLFLAWGVVALSGCTQKQEETAATIFNDLKVASADVSAALPTVLAAAEIIAPNSTKTAVLASVTGKITKANNVLQSVTLTFPPATTTTANVLSTVQVTSSVLAQLAPAAAQIAESTAPGSTAGVDLTKGTAVLNLVNGALQSVSIAAPATTATPAPASAPTD